MSCENASGSGREHCGWLDRSEYGGGGLSFGTTAPERLVTGDRTIPAAVEISSRPSIRVFNCFNFSLNLFASRMVHLAIVKQDLCFWCSRIRCCRVVQTNRVSDLSVCVDFDSSGGWNSYCRCSSLSSLRTSKTLPKH